MPSFRFLRPDDFPLLAAAVNACYDVHFPGTQPYSTERARREMKDLGLWASSCMLALEDKDPASVLVGARGAQASSILRLGTHPDHQRRGHAGHMLESLVAKMRIVGPKKLRVELPEERADLRAFFAKRGFKDMAELRDYGLETELPAPAHPEMITPLNLNDVEDRLPNLETCAWTRGTVALRRLGEKLSGLGVNTMDGIAAYLLYPAAADPGAGRPVEILALGCADASRAHLFLGMLCAKLHGISGLPLMIPRLAQGEISFEIVENLGFSCTRRYRLYERAV